MTIKYPIQPEEIGSQPKGNYLKEADTRSKLIDPLLLSAGWREEFITREYPVSAGRIEVIGTTSRRAPAKKADYILRVSPWGSPLAVVEAKEELKSATHGLHQAKEYARKLGVLFAYATNGREIEEFDFATNIQTECKSFPTPESLKKRFFKTRLSNLPKPEEAEKIWQGEYYRSTDFSLRHYQEAAIQNTIQAITESKKRILLALATGTGKTVIAFNLAWRLVKSGYFKRVLFISDRNFLSNQAYNTFGPFGEARVKIEEGKAPKHQDIYFGIYQALYSLSSSGKRLFEEYPADFFDLIIIDECHRSGFGTWKEILKHFSGAVHLGMTATPKRADNINTYSYFGDPVYTYSYGQGVQDGYLAPFIVHRILTDIDKKGQLEIAEAKFKGAEIIYPEDSEIKDIYSQKEFERTITLPDRTREIAKHLAKLLKAFDPMAKTMVFCVDSDHAETMAKELQNEFADLGFDNFAVPIIARTGDIKEADYERFRDSEKSTPVIATTVDLLTTGVDVPSVRNVVLIKPIASKIVFKQIIGRGSRIDAITNKSFFRIFDYVGATKLFDEWERVDSPDEEEEEGPSDFFISGIVIDAQTQEPISNVTIALQKSPNNQLHQKTNNDGRFSFSDLAQKKYPISFSATDYRPRTLSIPALENPQEEALIELALKGGPRRKIIVKGLPIYIAEEERLLLEKEGKTLDAQEYIQYIGKEVVGKTASTSDLKKIWIDPQKRKLFLEELSEKSIYPDVLKELLNRPDVDDFDLLSHAAFKSILLSRDERVEAVKNLNQQFLNSFPGDAKEVILTLLEKYRSTGIEEIENPVVFELSPFNQMGKLDGIIQRFGNINLLKTAMSHLRERIYCASAK